MRTTEKNASTTQENAAKESAQRYLLLDYESFSEADLGDVGSWEYSMHPSTEILCVAYREGTLEELPRAPVRLWYPSLGTAPVALVARILNPANILVAHNAYFEQVITRNVLPKYIGGRGTPARLLREIPPNRWICTASLAAPLALPRKLEGVGAVLCLKHQKNKEGHRLMLKMSKPRKPTKHDPSTRHRDPEDFKKLLKYCVDDIKAETDLFLSLPRHIPTERRAWVLDQTVNLRGVRVDRDAVHSIISMIEVELKNLEARTHALTGGDVERTTQVKRVATWLAKQGVHLPNLQAKTIEDALDANMVKGKARELLEIRQSASLTSIAKYYAFEARTRSDSCARDFRIYHGASTGRDTGVGIQLHNLPRGTIKDAWDAVELIRYGDPKLLRFLYGDVLRLFSACIRSMIIPREGNTFYCGDYSSIEVRVLFWMAGHEMGLEAYRNREDLYIAMAAVIFGVKKDKVTREQREVGKRAILGCLAKGTPVLTQNGYKPIEQISKADWVWNGEMWVSHEGVLESGHRSVISIGCLGLELTDDHWVKWRGVWCTAGEIALREDIPPPRSGRFLGLRLLSLPSTKWGRNAVSLCAAYAELKRRLESTNFGPAKTELVSLASNLFPDKRAEIQTETAIFCWTLALEHVSKQCGGTSANGVSTPTTTTSCGMVVEEYKSPSTPFENFWNILLRLSGLTNGGSLSTELIMTDTTPLETYASLLPQIPRRIVATFDLMNVSNGNQFQAGQAIVHNCGYGMGATKFFDTCKKFGQEIDLALAKKSVTAYRETHGRVPAMWQNLERAAIAATRNPGKVYKINRTAWYVEGNFLYCRLPSGRTLAYYKPFVRYVDPPWVIMRRAERAAKGLPPKAPGENDEKIPALHHYGVDPTTKQWGVQKTWGGVLVENVVQAAARDYMVEASLRLEAAGYENDLSIYDELLCEKRSGNLEEFRALMAEAPEWAAGLPISVDAWEGPRYKKG